MPDPIHRESWWGRIKSTQVVACWQCGTEDGVELGIADARRHFFRLGWTIRGRKWVCARCVEGEE